ncbi:hypothetical protein ACQF36_28805 [Streptomyces sp. Marseille-Q5077]
MRGRWGSSELGRLGEQEDNHAEGAPGYCQAIDAGVDQMFPPCAQCA